VILGNRSLSPFIDWDYGIALQTILLGLTEKGLGACAIASFHQEKVRECVFAAPEFEIAAVVAIGKPIETVIIEDMKDNEVRYWRDAHGRHHVPKRSQEQLIYRLYSK
jgi:nitroreductase